MDFLNIEQTGTFNIFSLPHLICLSICIILCAFLYLRKNSIRRGYSGRWLFIILAFFALVFEVIYMVWTFAIHGESNIIYMIPFDFTFIAIVLSVLVFFTKRQDLFELFYFISFFGIINLIVPNFGQYGINHFRFYQYFICNIFVVFSLVYFVFINFYNIKKKEALYSYSIFIILLILLNAGITRVSGINYFVLMCSYLPSLLINMFGGILATIIMCAISIILAIITFIPWKIYNKSIQEKYSIKRVEEKVKEEKVESVEKKSLLKLRKK